MNAAMDESEQLFEQLAGIAAAVESVPEHVDAAARAAFAFRDVDAAIAALIRDTADEPQPAGVRDADPDRLLSFEVAEPEGVTVTVELQVAAVSPAAREVVGHIVGSGMETATVETARGSRDLTVDGGFFIARDVPAGPVRLRFTTERGARVATSWVRV